MFEGTLYQCLHTPSSINNGSVSKDISRDEETHVITSAGTNVVDAKHLVPQENDERITIVQKKKLREEKYLGWAEVNKRFSQLDTARLHSVSTMFHGVYISLDFDTFGEIIVQSSIFLLTRSILDLPHVQVIYLVIVIYFLYYMTHKINRPKVIR